MARFDQVMRSETSAINYLADQIEQRGTTGYLARSTGAATLTAAQMVGGFVNQSGTPGAFALTTPTATQLIDQLANPFVGASFEFGIRNGGDGTITVTAGTGVTLVGTTAVPASKTQLYTGVVTNVDTPAVSLIGKLFAPI